jgi:hypothetical protein
MSATQIRGGFEIFFSEYIKMACSFEYWSFEILVLFAGLMPESQLSTSIIAMW